jgi:signal transduction histidine kinase
MKVSDNGRGFDEREVVMTTAGNGLSNMAARARALSAQFKLSSVKGKGTSVEVRVPIT